jgi:hypothetical protein
MCVLTEVLNGATTAELAALAKLVDAPGTAAHDLLEALQKQATSAFGFYALGKRPSYEEIVNSSALRLSLSTFPSDTPVLERRIVQHLWQTVWDRMTPEQRAEFNHKLNDAAQRSSKSIGRNGSDRSGPVKRPTVRFRRLHARVLDISSGHCWYGHDVAFRCLYYDV